MDEELAVGTAVGLLVMRHDISPTSALDLLTQRGDRTGVALAVAARQLIVEHLDFLPAPRR